MRPGDKIIHNTPHSLPFFSARVKKIILDDKQYPDLFKKLGEWDSIGTIIYEDIHKPLPEIEDQNFAYPLFPNEKLYPLINEAVFIFKLVSLDIQGNPSNIKNYYFTSINLWNNTNHNALPDNIFSEGKKTYDLIETGNTQKVIDDSIILGQDFIEKIIKNLKIYEGDYILEGRWGNSIRLSSTNNKTPWKGPIGDPIIIINNRKSKQIIQDFEPENEDLVNDDFIAITTSQQLPINDDKQYNSYKNNKPENNKSFNKSQIILNSERIILNSKNDHILQFSNKSINLNAPSINVDSRDTIIQSNKIYLGDKNAIEPVLLGNQTLNLLKQLLISLSKLSKALPTVGTPVPGTPNVQVAASATDLEITINNLLSNINSLLSKKVYVK